MNCNWYSQLLVHHSLLVIISVAAVSITCIVLSLTLNVLPDFSDPQLGFETRGTIFSNRIIAWENLEKATKPSGSLAVNPKEFLQPKNNGKYGKIRLSNSRRFNKTKVLHPNIFLPEDKFNRTILEENRWVALHNLINDISFNGRLNGKLPKEDYFCGSPDGQYAHIVWKSDTFTDLFTLESLFALCRLEYELAQAKYYKDLCAQTFRKPKRCCKPWSLANYVAELNNRSSCLAIVEEDIDNMKGVLKFCSRYYHTLKLTPDCFESKDCSAPPTCTQHNAVFNILHFLTSTSFLSPDEPTDVLEETMIFLPIASSTAVLHYYHVLEKTNLKYKGISAVAMDFGIKSALFNEYIIRDTWLMGCGALFVFWCIWIYTKSIFVTLMTIIAIIFSLGISYFMYTVVFQIRFFPFMNLLSTIVTIGIGADDAFIFCKAWDRAKAEENTQPIKIMTASVNHAFISMFITSITTAVAIFASFISPITTIRCFSLFTTTAVICNYILMITWLPASLVLEERIYRKCGIMKNWCSSSVLPSCTILNRLKKCNSLLLCRIWNNREEILINSVIRFRYYWIAILSSLTVASAVIVLYYPKLQLPNSPDFQLLDSSHPFEMYNRVYKNKFWFERSDKNEDGNYANYKLPLRFVWGVRAVDNGNYLDPQSLGTLEFDPNFDMSKKESQIWLLNFCREVRNQPFYQSTLGALLPNCFIESFMGWMQRRCLDPIYNIDRTPCCEKEQFPFTSTVFNECIVLAMGDLYETPSEYFTPGMAGPKFSKDEFSTIKAVVVEYDSNYSYSISFQYMHTFFTQVESWMNEQLKTAPLEMKGGWFVSDFAFYDLQGVLSQGTFTAIGISMALALAVLMLVTLNVFTSIYAIVTITCSIFAIIAVLILLGWKLNVLESIAISTTIGLTVDFSLHYTVHYRLCPSTSNRLRSTRFALVNMVGPASMAAISTSAVGAFMMLSIVLPYTQIGVFLITVMSVSWIFATFYLGSLLATIGPENDFGQFRYSKLQSCTRTLPLSERIDRPVSSSLSEVHELVLLTDKPGSSRSDSRLQRDSRNIEKSISLRQCLDKSPSATSTITVIMTDDN